MNTDLGIESRPFRVELMEPLADTNRRVHTGLFEIDFGASEVHKEGRKVDQPQQVSLRNLIVQAEVVEQRFRARMLPHHDEQASESCDPTEHGKDFFLLPRFGHHSTC
jgi:hypothetical protein